MYEKTAITDTTNAIPTQASTMDRDEMVVEHFRPKAKPAVGQINTNSDKMTAEAPAEPAESVQLSPQVAALARKEQRFRRDEQALKAEKAAIEAERKELAELRTFKSKLDAKDYSALDGKVSYDDYTNYLIEKSETLSPEAKALQELKAKVEGIESSQKEDVQKRFDAAVQERKRAITELVDSSTQFPRIKKLAAQEHVLQHILDTWENDGEDLSPEQAAKEVEEVLKERALKWAELAKEESDEIPLEDNKKQLPPLKPVIKTLTNNMAATGEIKRPVKSFQNMSDSERYAEARRRAEEKLKERTNR